MNIKEYMKEHLLYLDGGMGTLLQKAGLAPGEHPSRWCLSHPDVIRQIHLDYFNAGANVVCANTFGANRLKLDASELDEVIGAAIGLAREAAAAASGDAPRFVALDIGPCGKLLAPLGDLDFEDAVSLFGEVVRCGVKHGADLIFIETMTDSYETKAALLAAKESCDLPVFVSNAYGDDGKLMTGATPAAMVALLEGMGADAIGVNCSLGPDRLEGVVEEILTHASTPVILKPNAGLPRVENGNTVYDIEPDRFAELMSSAIKRGVRIAGGCCGTTPAHIAALTAKTSAISPLPIVPKANTVVSSYTHAVVFDKKPILIGERINPTGKKRFKQALIEGDIDYILNEGIGEEAAGAAVLDVNVGIPEIDEPTLLTEAVCKLQTVTALPLQIDTASPAAMERALRRYNGKAMINSVSGKRASMDAIFPLVKKYGGVVVALTLDESGIPDTVTGRIDIARRILSVAADYGIDKKDIVFDTLTMTVSTDPHAALTTLEALSYIKRELGCHTSLGVSNVSFGLPHRDVLNSTFFTAAMEAGLSAAIMNPYSAEMQKAYHAWCVLHGLDENCANYIDFTAQLSPEGTVRREATAQSATDTDLIGAIEKGRREHAAALTKAALVTTPPLTLIEEHIIPALNRVGRGFEEKTVFLPQLLMSAEAAGAAFDVIKAAMGAEKSERNAKTIVLATVQGDIHDIGKNIVRLLLENYGFHVIDLGRDVAPEKIVETAKAANARLVGLSALMTTTVPAMAKTVTLLHEQLPHAHVMVGGAVLTAGYAAEIGADHYAKDAMGAVRIAEAFFADLP